MKDFLRKTWFFGLGLLDFTTEKVEALVEEMVKRGELNQQESPQAVEQIMAKAQEAQQALFDKVRELVKKSMAEMKLARAADLAALEKRVEALEKELQDRPELIRE
jgi:polyhydroxyalkanoate synthesis regulator phasin